MKSVDIKVALLPFLASLMLLSSAVYAAPGKADAGYHLSGTAWAEAYYDFFPKHHLKTNTRLMLPQVWLFSPQGKMVRIASKDKDPQLAKFAAAFPNSVGNKALPGKPSSTQAHAFLEQALSDESVPTPDKGHWYAVLLLMDRPAPHECKQCAAYKKTLHDIQAKHPDLLDTVQITIVLSR